MQRNPNTVRVSCMAKDPFASPKTCNSFVFKYAAEKWLILLLSVSENVNKQRPNTQQNNQIAFACERYSLFQLHLR